MAFYSRKEFALLAGYSSEGTKWKGINMCVKRGEIITSGSKIDDTIPQNKIWLEKQQASRGIFEKPVIKTTPFVEEKPTQKSRYNSLSIESEIKKADLEKKQKDIKLADLKIAKLEGELIPTDLVRTVISELSEAMKIAYMDAMENYTTVIARQTKLSIAKESEIKKHFTRIINDTLDRQVVIAIKSVKKIVDEYSETRGRGESK